MNARMPRPRDGHGEHLAAMPPHMPASEWRDHPGEHEPAGVALLAALALGTLLVLLAAMVAAQVLLAVAR